MKNKVLAIILFSFFSHLSLAQIAISDLKQLSNQAQFKDTEKTLASHFIKSLRYPAAFIRNPEVCTVLGVIKVSGNGKIEEIGTLNKVPKPFKDQFVAAAKLTDGYWTPTNETPGFYYIVVPVEFSYEGTKYSADFHLKPKTFSKPIITKVFSQADTYKDDAKYLEKVNESVSKEKYKKAVETMEFLLSRQPFNTEYYRKIIELNTKLGIQSEADYYTTLLEIISNKN